ncbi:MAG: rhomboid family intramembrane serine protease [Bacteroidota bacterium]
MMTGSITNDIRYQFRHGNMVMKLIFINVGVFLFFAIFNLFGFLFQDTSIYQLVLTKVETPGSLDNLLHQPWSLFTYMFLHTGFFHVLFNMLWFYWFGEIFVLYLGDKKILSLYMIGGIAGAVTYILAFNFIPVFKPAVEVSYMLGASASVFALVFATVTLNPDYEVRLLFLGVVRIKYIALVAILLDIINIPNGNAGGYMAHIGGAISGYLYIKALQGGFDIASPLNKTFDWLATVFKRKPKMKMTYKNTEENSSAATKKAGDDQKRVDEILDKISRSGYDGLTKEEKDFLFHYSKKG